MALSIEEFTAASSPRRAVCSVAKILGVLDAKDRAVLTDAMRNPNVTHAAVAKVLCANGHDVRQSTVSRHRGGGCACGS